MSEITAPGLSGARLTVGYGGDPVLHDVDVRLGRGQVTALIGPNGSGKSTLLRGLSSLLPLSSGEVTVDNKPLRALGPRELARTLAVLTQGRPALSGMTVREVAELGRHPHRGRWRHSDPDGEAAVDRALALTGLTDLGPHDIGTLSGDRCSAPGWQPASPRTRPCCCSTNPPPTSTCATRWSSST